MPCSLFFNRWEKTYLEQQTALSEEYVTGLDSRLLNHISLFFPTQREPIELKKNCFFKLLVLQGGGKKSQKTNNNYQVSKNYYVIFHVQVHIACHVC